MMKDFVPNISNLIAFLAVIGAIVFLASGRTSTVDLSIMTGLIGVLGSFRPWTASSQQHGPSGTPADPLAVEGADDPARPVPTTAAPTPSP
jgi:hypothetical protein